MDVTRTVTYQGPAARASALVQMLEDEGVRVKWSQPREERGPGADVNEMIVYLTGAGTLAAITAAVRKFRKWAPWAKVKVEGEPDDGGFLDEPTEPKP